MQWTGFTSLTTFRSNETCLPNAFGIRSSVGNRAKRWKRAKAPLRNWHTLSRQFIPQHWILRSWHFNMVTTFYCHSTSVNWQKSRYEFFRESSIMYYHDTFRNRCWLWRIRFLIVRTASWGINCYLSLPNQFSSSSCPGSGPPVRDTIPQPPHSWIWLYNCDG